MSSFVFMFYRKQLSQYLPNSVVRIKKKSSTVSAGSMKRQMSDTALRSLDESSVDLDDSVPESQQQIEKFSATSNDGIENTDICEEKESRLESDVQVGVKRRGVKRPSSPLEEDSSPVKKIREQAGVQQDNLESSNDKSNFKEASGELNDEQLAFAAPDNNLAKNSIKLTLKEIPICLLPAAHPTSLSFIISGPDVLFCLFVPHELLLNHLHATASRHNVELGLFGACFARLYLKELF
eukprot:gene20519-22536_t